MEFDFSKNQELDQEAYDKVPADFQAAYVEKDGKYVISDTAKGMVAAITGLNKALTAERATSKTLKTQKDVATAVKDVLGFDSLEAAKEQFETLTQQVAEGSKVDPAKIKAEIQATFDGQLADKDAEMGVMQKSLEKYMVDAAAAQALSTAKGNPALLMPLIRDKVALVKDGDDYVVRVKDEAGDYRGDGKGGFMGVDNLVDEMKKSNDFGVAFESDNTGGSGPNKGPRPANPGTQQQSREDMSPNELISAGLEAQG